MNKQMVFLIALTLLGTVGAAVFNPFYSVLIYHLYALLRPQYLWRWVIPEGIAWSFYVAMGALAATAMCLFGAMDPDPRPAGQPRPAHRMTLAHWSVLWFGAWVIVTYFTGQDLGNSHADNVFLDYLKIFLMYVVTFYLTRTVGQAWALYVMAAATLAYIAYEVNFLYVFNGYLGIYFDGWAGLDNNGAGLMLAMGAPLCWFLVEGLSRWWRWGFALLVPFIVHATLLTYSRGAMVSLVAVVPLMVLRSRYRLRMAVGVVLFAAFALPVLAGTEIQKRFLTLEKHEVDETANQRRLSWMAGLRIAQDYPVFGVGVRNAVLLSRRYGADMENRVIHNQYIQLAADNGFPGAALYLALMAFAWFSLRRCRRWAGQRTDTDARRVRAMAAGVECSLAVYAVGAMFLSLEVFELPWLLLFLAAQTALVSGADDEAAAEPALHGVAWAGAR